VQNFKSTTPMFQDFLKTLQRYQQAIAEVHIVGQQLADIMAQLSSSAAEHHKSASETLACFSEIQRSLETQRLSELKTGAVETFAEALKLEQRHKEMAQAEKTYKKELQHRTLTVKKLENQIKRNKPDLNGLKQSLKGLKSKVQESEEFQNDKLQEVLNIEKQRYMVVVDCWSQLTKARAQYHQSCLQLLSPHKQSEETDKLPERAGLSPRLFSKPKSAPLQRMKPRKETEENGVRDKKGWVAAKTPKGEDEEEDEEALSQLVVGLFQWVPRAEDELTVEVGAEMRLVKEVNADWWLCSKDGKVGLIPADYVKKN